MYSENYLSPLPKNKQTGCKMQRQKGWKMQHAENVKSPTQGYTITLAE